MTKPVINLPDISHMTETNKAIQNLKESAPEALDTAPRPPNADGSPTTNDEIIAIKLEFIPQDVEQYLAAKLAEGYSGSCVNIQWSDLNPADPLRKEEMVEEQELYNKHFTPYWVWDMMEHKHIRIQPDDPELANYDVATFVVAPLEFNPIVFIENRVMGPIPNVDEFLKKIEEEERAKEAARKR